MPEPCRSGHTEPVFGYQRSGRACRVCAGRLAHGTGAQAALWQVVLGPAATIAFAGKRPPLGSCGEALALG